MKIQLIVLLLLTQSILSCQQPSAGGALATAGVGATCSSPASQLMEEMVSIQTSKLVFRSSDSGKNWTDISSNLPETLGINRVTVDGGQVFLCAGLRLYTGSTTGTEWSSELYLNPEIDNIYPGKNGPYVSSYKEGLFKKVLGTAVLIPIDQTLADKTVRTVLETSDGSILAGCESGIYKSSDEGKTWRWVSEVSGINSFAAGNGILISGTYEGLLRSVDGGEHWDKVFAAEGSAYKTFWLGDRFVSIVDDSKDWSAGIVNQVYTSADGGISWNSIDQNLAPLRAKAGEESGITHIYEVTQAGKYLFCSTDAGIFRSGDWGGNWELVFPIKDKKKMLQLAVFGDVVYAVSVVGC